MGKAIVRDQHGCGSVSSPPQTAELVLFTSKLAQLECNWKLRLFKDWRWPKIFVMSRKKSLRFKAIVQGLAVLLLFALSVVLSITFFAIAFLSLSMFQYSVFSQQMNTTKSIVRKPIFLALTDTQLKLNSNCFKNFSSPEFKFALVLLLLLCGDVEINPGPQGKPADPSNEPRSDAAALPRPLSPHSPPLSPTPTFPHSHSHSVLLTSQDYVQFYQEQLELQDNVVEAEPLDLPQPIQDSEAQSLTYFQFYQEQLELQEEAEPLDLPQPIQDSEAQANVLSEEAEAHISGVEVVRPNQSYDTLSIKEARKLLHEQDKYIKQKDEQIKKLQCGVNVHSKLEWPNLPLVLSGDLLDLLDMYNELQTKVVNAHNIDYQTLKVKQNKLKKFGDDLLEWLSRFMELLKTLSLWSDIDGTFCSQEIQWIFLISMNQLLRLQKAVDYCPLCCRNKHHCCICKANCCGIGCEGPCNCRKVCAAEFGMPKSHIWPNCLLLACGNINRVGIEKHIMNLTTEVPKVEQPENMCLKMLCNLCEKKAAKIEDKLGKAYKFIKCYPDNWTVIDNKDDEIQWIFADC